MIGSFVVNVLYILVYLGVMGEIVKWIIVDNLWMSLGDVFVINDFYCGGSHLLDVMVVIFVHYDQLGELLFFMVSCAHHVEIGGIVFGSMLFFFCNLGEEGILI